MPQMLHSGWYERTLPKLTKSDVPDCVFPTNNVEGIPVLRMDYMANALDIPLIQWGQRRRTDYMFGTWGFYVDDYRFQALWKDPTPVINSGAINAIEPNFSVHNQLPRAVALWHTYRKRWLARYWQEFGQTRIFVDLNVGELYWEDNMLGVPRGWLAYATRGYSGQQVLLDAQYEMSLEWAGKDQKEKMIYIVYGGPKEIKEHCIERNWIWIAEQQDHHKKNEMTTDVAEYQGGVGTRPMDLVFTKDGEESFMPRRTPKKKKVKDGEPALMEGAEVE